MLLAACTATAPSSDPDLVASRLIVLLKDSNPDARRTAALSLGKIAVPGSAVETALLNALHDPDRLVRQYSAWALGMVGEQSSDKVGTALVGLLGDTSPDVATTAAEAIGKLGATQRVIHLLKGALRDPSVNARRAAVKALGWLESASTFPALAEALKDDDAEVRQGVISALGELGNRGAVLLMQDRLLHDPVVGVRSESAYRLGKLGDETAVPSLEAVGRRDLDNKVRRWAQWAIQQLASSGEPGSGT